MAEHPKAPANAKQVDKADLILLSHGHADHLGEPVEVAKKTNARILSMNDLSIYFGNQGIPAANLVRMNIGGTASAIPGTPIKVTLVRADHSSTVSCTDPPDQDHLGDSWWGAGRIYHSAREHPAYRRHGSLW